jgi:hypothetical protein
VQELENRAARKFAADNARYFHFNAGEGQATVCIAMLPSGKFTAGLALCSPDDQFNRATGRYLSISRALNSKSLLWRECSGNKMSDAITLLTNTLKEIYNVDFTHDNRPDIWATWMPCGGEITPRGRMRGKNGRSSIHNHPEG